MAKKIRFPLKMANGADVRTIEELRENFDLESILGYYASGKLVTWLSDRYYDIESERMKLLDASSEDLNRQVCEILGVEYTDESSETDIESLRIRNEKIAKLRQITDKQEIIEAVDSVAFDQDELFDLLDEDTEVIYLYGEKFSIPLGKGNVKYIGINSPEILINSQVAVDWNEKGIVFENVHFNEKYKVILEVNKEEHLQKFKSSGAYNKKSYLNFMISNDDIKKSEEIYNNISPIIMNINYDINADTVNIKNIIRNSCICEVAQKYIDRL